MMKLDPPIDPAVGSVTKEMSDFFWTDPRLFDDAQARNLHTLIASQQVLKRRYGTSGFLERDLDEALQEFFDLYDKIAAHPSQVFVQIWSDPAAYHWCQLTFDLMKSLLTRQPLPLVTQNYCRGIEQKTLPKALAVHLSQFKLFAIAHGILTQQPYQFPTPFRPRLPLAIPGTTFYLEGLEPVEIYGVNLDGLKVVVKGIESTLALTAIDPAGGSPLKLGQCPNLQQPGWKLRLQPYCFNSPAFADGLTIVQAGMAYQWQYINLVQEGLALIERYHLQTFQQLHYFMQVMALKPLGVGGFTNLTSSDFPGALVCSVINHPYRLADNLIHEFHHNRLFLIEQDRPLLLNDVEDIQANNLYYSPWRTDLRPLRGILHAVYVYTPVAQFWLAVYCARVTGELQDLAASQLLTAVLQLQLGLEQLRRYAQFTDLGRCLFQELESQVEHLVRDTAAIEFPADVPALEFQQNGSFLPQLQSRTARLLSVKAAMLDHIRRFDRFHQVGAELQAHLGLDLAIGDLEETVAAPAIAYGAQNRGTIAALPTLAEALQQRLDHFPDSVLVNLQTRQSKSYGELWQQAMILLSYLQAQGLAPGDLLILYLENCHDFVAAAWSCFLGGFVPIPVGITASDPLTAATGSKLHQVWQMLSYPPILTTGNHVSQVYTRLHKPQPNILVLDKAGDCIPSDRFHRHPPEELALLLASSGTTGTPKLISFDALTVTSQFFSAHPVVNPDASCWLSWIPFDNASGFNLISPSYQQVLYWPVEDFFQDPQGWLEVVDRYQVNVTMLTNFAMSRITAQVKQAPHSQWNLTSLKRIGLGAEKIIAQTCRDFVQTLQPFGLGEEVLNFAYGLSECGVIASTNKLLEVGYADRSEQFVQVGQPLTGCAIRIVDAANRLLNEGEVGRIQVRGAGMTRGYYHRPDLNRALFTEDGWLNTGDLGFLCRNALTITGREKDIVIINGRNFSCQEIESVADAIEGVEPFSSVACPVHNLLLDKPNIADRKLEQFAVFFVPAKVAGQISPNSLAAIATRMKQAIATQLGISPTFLIPLTAEQLPRTATGKVQRYLLAQRLEAGEFQPQLQQMADWLEGYRSQRFAAVETELEQKIAQLWAAILGVNHVGRDDNFFALGGASLTAIQFCAEMSAYLDRPLPVVSLFQAQTVGNLATLIRENQNLTPKALLLVRPTGSKPPLVFIHSAATARHLIPWIHQDQPIYDLNLFGLTPLLKDRLNHLNLKDIAQLFVQDLQTVQPHGSYQLVGYCQNAPLTLEVARELQQRGETVALLCLIDALFTPYQPTLWHRLLTLREFGGRYLWLKLGAKLVEKWEQLKRSQGDRPPESVSSDQLVDKVLADRQLYVEYLRTSSRCFPPPYPGKITLLLSNEWRFGDLSSLRNIAAGGLDVYPVKGLHHHLFEEPYVQSLAEELQRCLCD